MNCKKCTVEVKSNALPWCEPNLCGFCVVEFSICPWCETHITINSDSLVMGYFCKICDDYFGVDEETGEIH